MNAFCVASGRAEIDPTVSRLLACDQDTPVWYRSLSESYHRISPTRYEHECPRREHQKLKGHSGSRLAAVSNITNIFDWLIWPFQSDPACVHRLAA